MFFSGVRKCISLTYFVFNSSLLGQEEKLNFIFLLKNLYSGFVKKSKGESKN
jgi:hypothetical protein